MRVLVTRRKEEGGAIAIIFTLMIVVVLVLAAMTVDFGLAYTYKRQAQTAADAAVLAAGTVYVDETGSCSTLAGNGSLKAAAKVEADKLLQKNLPGATGQNFTVACNADEELTIAYGVLFNSPLTLGKLAKSSGQQQVTRDATATFDRSLRGQSGMRPWPICSNSFDITVKKVTQIVAGVKDNVGCPGMEVSGTWGRFACPGYAKGDGSDKDDKPTSSLYWIRYGCPNAASPVPGQPDGSDPVALRNYLVNYAECKAMDKNAASTEFCLARDTGSAQNKKMEDAWQQVIDVRQTVEIPVICSAGSTTNLTDGDCETSDAVTSAPVLPIYRLAVVHVCGMRMGSWSSSNWPSTGPCATLNPDGWTSSSPVLGNKSAFYVVVEGVITGTDDGTIGGDSNLRLIK